MSRLIIILMTMQVTVLATLVAVPPLQDTCSPLDAKESDIVWNAPTNHIPNSLRIYRVISRKFSPTVVSNLLQIVGLKPEQRKKVDQGGVFSGKDVLFFADQQETRQLNLIPSQGFVVISQIGVEAQIPKEMPDGVPSPATALQSTLEILDKIGVSRSEIATNSDGQVKASYTESEVIHKDKIDGQIKTNIVKRELYLNRQIDGIPVLGNRSGVTAHFGNNGKLGYLSVVWRAIIPERDCIVPNATELICRIKDGQALIPNWAQGYYKKITIEKVHIYYWENSGSEPQTHIYPFIILNVKAEKENREIKMDLFVPFAEK